MKSLLVIVFSFACTGLFAAPQVKLLDSPFRDNAMRESRFMKGIDARALTRMFRVTAGLETREADEGLPGLPILKSVDLLHWKYVGYALARHPWQGSWRDESPLHGKAVWAPSIRARKRKIETRTENGVSLTAWTEYVIYWGDPDRGIYRVTAKDNPAGPWSEPVLVKEGKGMIDPCPLYDDDGRIYLVHGWAASRAKMNSVLTVSELNADETATIGEEIMVYDGLPDGNFTAEGPKFYKRNGEYWLFFPAGGVERGWQVAARAKSPFGPYSARTVMA